MNALERLERTRDGIAAHIAGRQRPSSRPDDPHASTPDTQTGAAPLTLLGAAASHWWSEQPASQLLALAKPVLNDYARQNPIQLLAVSFLTGAAVVVTGPWWARSLQHIPGDVLKVAGNSGLFSSFVSTIGPTDRK